MSRKKRKKSFFRLAPHDALYLAGFLLLFVSVIVLPLWLFIAALLRPSPPPTTDPDGIPLNTGRITDHSRILSPDDLDRLNTSIDAFETATQAQIALLLLPTLGDIPIEDLATRTFNAWGIGHADRDDGILLLRATGDHRDRLEIGYGLEGAITDARAGDILREMAPYLRADDWSGALTLALLRLQETLLGSEPSDFPAPRKPPFRFSSLLTWTNLIFLLLLLGLGSLITAACIEPGGGGSSACSGRSHGLGTFGSSPSSHGASNDGSRSGFGGGRSGGAGASGRW